MIGKDLEKMSKLIDQVKENRNEKSTKSQDKYKDSCINHKVTVPLKLNQKYSNKNKRQRNKAKR